MALSVSTGLYHFVMDFKSSEQGWSEGLWINSAERSGVKPIATQLLDYRMALLPPTCSLVYSKYSNVDKEKDSIPVARAYPLAGLWPGDPFTTPATAPAPGSLNIEVSQIAVHLRVWTADGVACSRWVHGVPDNRVTAEVLTDAITTAIVAPPAIGAGGFSTDWATRFGYYMYLVKTLTVFASPKVQSGVLQWRQDAISDMIVRGVKMHKTGIPFGLSAGRARVG